MESPDAPGTTPGRGRRTRWSEIGPQLPPGRSAYVHRDTLKKTKAIRGGVGKYMMEKMGWCEGQGLGARKQGPLEPILPSIKQDMKGLASEGEKVSSLAQRLLSHLPDNTTRLPVTMLEEYCAGRQLAAPQYELMEEAGPPHKKLFVMRVKVNDIYYQPTVACMTKKEAKHLAAVVSLQAFGILPKDPPQVQLKMQFQQNDEKRSMS